MFELTLPAVWGERYIFLYCDPGRNKHVDALLDRLDSLQLSRDRSIAPLAAILGAIAETVLLLFYCCI